ncbi:TlpA disulfide reductase family protein [Alkalihalophilus sp. As8PL]|uniref:TlpA disulfide reductase family protein n=1 Tax=Alkalihalophilus sp. As8PL TaxID=3237103 RepID=A0AB39BTD3_9BACI
MSVIAPNFTLTNPSQTKKLSLESLKGKVVLLTFWTSWCPDSKRDLSEKHTLYQSMKNDDVAMVFIHVTGRDSSVDVEAWLDEMNLTFPVYSDVGTKTYDAYRCMGVPTTILIDKKQQIVATYNDQARFILIVKGLGELLD